MHRLLPIAAILLAGCHVNPCRPDVTALTGPGWGSTSYARCYDDRQTLTLETINGVVLARCVCGVAPAEPKDGGQ